ncbi:extracellular solute-binding protein [Muricoccus pecuniae]|uniref:Putative spermidine/putrescine transport system substrate-binding protein n=1 Tax=Muricoccus pecuniae TaxID=693023 RepID=A0A840YFL4_9PROT|nr:extracellular solute-binding protein [Roseomonas pecuniae]MBB5693272.1 putative spermidine/putrescine transport system substrate-binding protein [Roseomonas pecuniae]
MTERHTGASRRHILGLGAAAAALPFMPHVARAQAGGRLVVSTWGGDYANLLGSNIDKPILGPKNIEVTQDVGTEPARIAKLIAQRRLPRGNVDIICAQAPASYDLNEAGLLEPLDEGKVPNMRHILPELRTNYALPHIFSPQIFIYNTERVQQPPTTFNDLMADRFKGKVGILDNSFIYVVMAAALAKTGDAMNVQAVKPELEKLIRDGNKTYTVTDAFAPALRSGEIDVGPVWQARTIFWQKAGVAVKSSFPTEGSVVYVSSMSVPKNAPNKAAAFAYLNAMLEPAAQRGFADSMGYLPTSSEATLEGEVAQRLALPEPRPKLVAPDYAKLAAVRDELNDWWRRLLDGR